MIYVGQQELKEKEAQQPFSCQIVNWHNSAS